MLVFRMETASGVGMYYHDASTNIINNGTSDRKKWPMPHDDERYVMNKSHHIKTVYPDTPLLDALDTYSQESDLINSGMFELYNEELYRFGFNNYAQLERWVSDFEWRKALVAANIYLNVYEVDERFAILGYTQCTFRFDKATLLHSFIATSSEEHILSVLMAKQSPSASAAAYYKDFYNENA